MKILFLGTPQFSATILEKLYNIKKHEIVGVVTKLDKPTGRGQKMAVSPVKAFAESKKIPCFQFKSISKEGFDVLNELNADVVITASFGQILRQNIIDMTRFGVINVHASLLPKYRGSSPIQWAVIKGEKKTGVTIMQTDIGVDTGDMLLKAEVDIKPDETSGELMDRLAVVGADALIEALDKLEKGELKREKQDDALSSWFPMLKKEDGKIDFSKSAEEIKNLCRGLNPWPICFVMLNETDKLKVFKAEPYDMDIAPEAVNGQVLVADGKKGLIVKCGDGAVLLEKIQAPNSKAMNSNEYLRGKKIPLDKVFE